jgi:hypothetical protein
VVDVDLLNEEWVDGDLLNEEKGEDSATAS